jgi:hypothetical protein
VATNAFQNYTAITFTIDVTLQNQQKETQILKFVCNKKHQKKSQLLQATPKKNLLKFLFLFTTDRNDTRNSDLNERFGGKRSEVQYGRIVVSIFYTHTLDEIERPSYWRLEFSEDPSKHVMMQSLRKQNKEDFFKQMKERIAKNGKTTFFLCTVTTFLFQMLLLELHKLPSIYDFQEKPFFIVGHHKPLPQVTLLTKPILNGQPTI